MPSAEEPASWAVVESGVVTSTRYAALARAIDALG
jgi:hypothetical protein